ncbi:HNH endonuclease [Streptomyces caniferus]|uniref:HNH endonuclease n=1 Tax=Streptomyces caniferus TaxID=285557 RepID=UPI00383BB01B
MSGISFAPVLNAKRGYYVDSDGGVYGPRGKLSPCPRTSVATRQLPGKGYLCVTLRTRGNTQTTRNVHRAVFEAFHGPVPSGMHVRHLNGDDTDNRLCNLAVGTPAENVADSIRNGARPVGERHHRAKLSDEKVLEIRRRHAAGGISYGQLGSVYGVTKQQVAAIVKRRQRRDI